MDMQPDDFDGDDGDFADVEDLQEVIQKLISLSESMVIGIRGIRAALVGAGVLTSEQIESAIKLVKLDHEEQQRADAAAELKAELDKLRPEQ